jgi:hypothetical protein
LRGQLEVEHILGAAKQPVPGLADELDRLVIECAWSDGGETPQGLIIPFRKWARTASAYCRSGTLGIVSLAQNEPAYLYFVLALLTELHNREALEAVMALASPVLHKPTENRAISLQASGAINLLLSFPPRISINSEEETILRVFLHNLLSLTTTAVERATVLCALRGVGNEESIQLMAAGVPLADPWDGVESTVGRAIRKRLKAGRGKHQ